MLKQKLHNLKSQEGKSTKEILIEIQDLTNQVAGVGYTLSNEELVSI